jgi:hypothetical protein
MNRKRLGKIERELLGYEASPAGRKPREFERIARRLGRRKVKRGSEPNYASPAEPDLGHPLSIPHHAVLKSGTAKSIINALLSDVDCWKQYLDQRGDDDDEHEDDEPDEETDENEADKK